MRKQEEETDGRCSGAQEKTDISIYYIKNTFSVSVCTRVITDNKLMAQWGTNGSRRNTFAWLPGRTEGGRVNAAFPPGPVFI